MKTSRLLAWLPPSVLAPAGLAAAAGFAQFAATASLADVATTFGISTAGADESLVLNGTTLGIGLGIIRLGSLGALPLASLADRIGRRRLILTCATLGLALTGTAAFTPGFWWFVAVLALARPLLSATNAVAVVVGAEVTRTKARSTAVAIIGAAYAVGSGIPALLRGAVDDLGFRPLFALAFVMLAVVPFGTRRLKEPDLYQRLARSQDPKKGRGALSPGLRSRLLILALMTAAAGLVTGPANTFVFYFAETVRGLSPSTMAAAVLAVGPIGLLGLVAGRWTADNIGRRLSAAISLAAIAGAAIFTYNVRGAGVVAGYLMAMFAASAFTPGAGAISAELFPTSFRSTAAGWLTAAGVIGAVGGLTLFGFLADALGGFGRASIAVAVPVILLSALYLSLPETRSIELEDPAPEGPLVPPV